MGSLEIVYHPERIRDIRLLSVENIDQVQIEGPKVQLQGIDKHARLCLQAESRALNMQDNGSYRLRNGPYMRRFLDGYYPMRVSLEIHYPPTLIEPKDFRPLPGKAGSLERSAGRIAWDSWFEGRLFTEFDFQRITP